MKNGVMSEEELKNLPAHLTEGVKVGNSYYFMVHAYHHFIGTVIAVTGRKQVLIVNAIRVQSCKRGWTEFLKDGCMDDTVFTRWVDGQEISDWFVAVPWRHDIPLVPKAVAA